MDMNWFEEMERRIPKGKVRTRFAPSPTGYMHVGNLRTALYTWLIARHSDGTFILRIEDTDQGRLVEGAVDVIYKTMTQCHLDHDEGPDLGGPVGPYIQTERRPLYGRYAELLVEWGHAYRCFCEKAESEEDSGDFGRGDDPCRSLSEEEARRQMESTDRARGQYYSHYTGREYGAQKYYHLGLDSGLLGTEESVESIIGILRRWCDVRGTHPLYIL